MDNMRKNMVEDYKKDINSILELVEQIEQNISVRVSDMGHDYDSDDYVSYLKRNKEWTLKLIKKLEKQVNDLM